jgi:fused signal recognition particle receptor
MIWFKKKNQNDSSSVDLVDNDPIDVVDAHPVADPLIDTPDAVSEKTSFFSRLKVSLSKTRQHFASNITALFVGKKTIDPDLMDALETILLTSDVGLKTTTYVLNQLTELISRESVSYPMEVRDSLCRILKDILLPRAIPLVIPKQTSPYVILMIGINGAGKTTTVGKLAKQFQADGHKVMLAAGDTFRAAAVEQLKVWGERNHIPVIRQHTGADSASVIFDAMQSAKAKSVDVLLVDTAGRLHTQHNLMEELKKIKRVMQKNDSQAPHEVLLVLDASIGQNAIQQVKEFHEALHVTGIVMTKLDGSAKGGVMFAIAHEFGIPLRYIGIGEGIDDLREFDATQFVNALFDDKI